VTSDRLHCREGGPETAASTPERPRIGRARRVMVLGAAAVAVGLVLGFCGLFLLPDRRHSNQPAQSADAASRVPAPTEGEPPAQRRATVEPAPAPPKTIAEVVENGKREIGRLVEIYPNDARVHELMATVHFFLGERQAASDSWTRCLELDPTYAEAYNGLGKVAALKGDYEEAAEMFRKAALLSPQLAEAVYQWADVLLRLGRMGEAVDVLEEHTRLHPSSAKPLVLLGQAYLQWKQFEDARTYYEAALRLEPDLSRAHFGLATALTRLGQPEAADEHFRKFKELRAKESKPMEGMTPQTLDFEWTCANFSVAYTMGGQIYRDAGQVDAAERMWRTAAVLNPKNLLCRKFLAALYQQAGRLSEALQVYEELVQTEPDNPAHYWKLGVLRARLQRFDAAEQAFRKITELAPESPGGYAGLAEVYLQSNRQLAEAERLAREALKRKPTAGHYLLLSRICARRGKRAEAIQAADHATALEPENAQVRRFRDQLRARGVTP